MFYPDCSQILMWRCNVLVQLSHESSTEDATWPKTKASRDTVFLCTVFFLYCDFHVDSSWFCYSDLDFVICWRWLVTWMRKKRRSTFDDILVAPRTFWADSVEGGDPQAAMDFQNRVGHKFGTAGVIQSDSKCRCSMMFHDVPWCSMTFESIWYMLTDVDVCRCSGLAKDWTDLHWEDWERVVAVWSHACFKPINQHVGLRWTDISWQPGRSRYRSGDCRRQVRICSKEMYD